MSKETSGFLANWPVIAIVIVAATLVFSQYQLSTILGGSTSAAPTSNAATGASTTATTAATSGGVKIADGADATQKVIDLLIQHGTPKDYGPELGVSFDNPVQSLQILATLDGQVPTSSLTKEQFDRFVSLGTKISCEFCCSAPAVVNEQGQDLCGCAHAAAFRGIFKYLITKHPTWTDDQMYWEATRWKSMFYPKDMVTKGLALVKAGLEITPTALNDRNLLSKLSTNDIGSVGQLPSMVGGC